MTLSVFVVPKNLLTIYFYYVNIFLPLVFYILGALIDSLVKDGSLACSYFLLANVYAGPD
jgi:hypothetical protein